MSKRFSVPRFFILIAGSLAIAAGLATDAVSRIHASTSQGTTLPPPPIGDLTARGAIKTVIIDPGHGGEEDGVHGVAGTKEKDLVLKFAQQLKTAIETRLGLKVLLTRETDDAVLLDERAVRANTHKGDLFISLHANASVRPELRGTEVIYLDADAYVTPVTPPPSGSRGRPPAPPPPPPQIPVVGGGTRVIEPVLWDLAQLPYVDRSKMFSATLVKRLTEAAIPSNTPLVTTAPLRVLAGVNMPAVLVELGFLTNADEETALNGAELPTALIEAIVNTIGDVRFGFPQPPPKPTIPR